MDMDSAPNVNNNAASSSAGDMSSSSDQPMTVKHMDPDLHKVAVKGETSNFEKWIPLDSNLTPNKNTILHVHIMAFRRDESTNSKKGNIVDDNTEFPNEEKSIRFIEEALHKCVSLVLQENSKGDTPLHVAAANGHYKMVEFLINYANDPERRPEGASEIMTKKNNEGNTALDIAVRHGNKKVAEFLVKSSETPISMVAFEGRSSVDPKYERSEAIQISYGKTALHEAIKNNNLDITDMLLDREKDKKQLVNTVCENWWTPLHYAAYYGCSGVVGKLLEVDICAAYIRDKERGMTPLHLAAAQRHFQIMKTIIDKCPDCYELTDSRGWNVLHFAFLSLSTKDLGTLLQDNKLIRSLLYEKDSKRNTPLHVLVTARRDAYHYILLDERNFPLNHKFCAQDLKNFSCSELEKEIKNLSENDDSSAGQYPRNVIHIRGKLADHEIKIIDKAKASQSVVAALITTVTFTAFFTLPGGYKGEEGPDKGTAILSRKAAFIAFVIIDTITMVLSMAAVFIYFLMALKGYEKDVRSLKLASWLIMSSMAGMVGAFATAAYLVLTPSWLAIITCVFALCFLPMVFCIILMAGKVD